MSAILSGAAANAQTNTAEIAGIVRDQQGARLPGATVAVLHLESRTRVEAITDAQGRYLLPALRLGSHEVTVELPGFKRVVQPGIVATLGDRLQLDFILEVGGLTESITVAGDAPLLQVTTAEISDVVANDQIVQMPLNTRDVLALAQLSDAVVLPPWWHPRGGAAAGRPAAERRRPALRPQHLPARWRQGHRRAVQQPGDQPLGRISRGVQDPEVAVRRRIRGQGLGAHQRGHAFGHQSAPRERLRVHEERSVRFPRVFRPRRSAGALPAAAPTRRGPRRPPRAQPDVLLRELRGAAPAPRAGPNLLGAVRGGARWRPRHGADRSGPHRSAVRGTFAVCTAAEPPGRDAKPRGHRGTAARSRRVQRPPRSSCHRIRAPFRPFQHVRRRRSAAVRHQRATGGAGAGVRPPREHARAQRGREPHPGAERVVDERAPHRVDDGSGGPDQPEPGSRLRQPGGLAGSHDRSARFGLSADLHAGPVQHLRRSDVDHHARQPARRAVRQPAGRSRTTPGEVRRLSLSPAAPARAARQRPRLVYLYRPVLRRCLRRLLLGYPTNAVSGIGRGDEDGRTTWLHLFAQDDWRVRDNLTLNLGLRYEYNQHMRDAQDRLSSVDYETPGGRYVIAGDSLAGLDPDAQALLPLIPIPYVTSEEAGWDRGLLSPSLVRLAPRTGFALALADSRAVVRGGYGIFLNQWAYSVQTAFARNLPFFYTRQVDVPATQPVPRFQTSDILTADPTGVISPTIMDHAYAVEYTQTWSGGLQYELLPATVAEVNYMGSWTLGADNATVRNVPEPGDGSIQPRREIPALGAIRSIRFDGKSIYHAATFKLDRPLRNRLAYSVSYTLSTSKHDASSPGATEAETNVPQDVRNVFDETGEWARSSFDHRHLFVASATWLLPRDWRVSAVFLARSGAPFTVNLGVDRANIGAGPAQRPDALRDANLPGGERTPDRWFDTSAFALPAPFTFGSARRNSVIGPGSATLDLSLAKMVGLGGTRDLELRVDVFNALNRANFDLPNRTFGTPNFGRIFSAKNARELQLGIRLSL